MPQLVFIEEPGPASVLDALHEANSVLYMLCFVRLHDDESTGLESLTEPDFAPFIHSGGSHTAGCVGSWGV